MFFDRLAISDIYKKSRDFSRKKQKVINEKLYIYITRKETVSNDSGHVFLKNGYMYWSAIHCSAQIYTYMYWSGAAKPPKIFTYMCWFGQRNRPKTYP